MRGIHVTDDMVLACAIRETMQPALDAVKETHWEFAILKLERVSRFAILSIQGVDFTEVTR